MVLVPAVKRHVDLVPVVKICQNSGTRTDEIPRSRQQVLGDFQVQKIRILKFVIALVAILLEIYTRFKNLSLIYTPILYYSRRKVVSEITPSPSRCENTEHTKYAKPYIICYTLWLNGNFPSR